MNNNDTISKKLLLSFIYSLTLCDHMGDAADVIDKVLKLAEIDIPQSEWGELSELTKSLKEVGAISLWLYADEIKRNE